MPRPLLLGLVTAGVLVVLTWGTLVVVARRHDLRPAALLPLLGSTPGALRRLRRDPRVPRRVRIVLGLTLVWVLSPIDLVPEFLPVIGPLDDIVVVVLALRHTARHVPRDVLLEAWPPDHRPLLDRLLRPTA